MSKTTYKNRRSSKLAFFLTQNIVREKGGLMNSSHVLWLIVTKLNKFIPYDAYQTELTCEECHDTFFKTCFLEGNTQPIFIVTLFLQTGQQSKINGIRVLF